MPYVSQEVRQILAEGRSAIHPGELNYLISKLCNDYLAMCGVSYNSLNEVHGVLACAQMELYRRVTAPYEDKKLGENGEVFNIL